MNEIVIVDGESGLVVAPQQQAIITPVRAYINSVSQKSKSTKYQALKRFVQIWTSMLRDEGIYVPENIDMDIYQVPFQNLTYGHLNMVRSDLANMIDDGEISPSYANNIIASVKGVLFEAKNLGMLSRDSLADMREIKSFKISSEKHGRLLELNEVRAMLQACNDDTVLGIRDGAIIAILASTGLRRMEICNLKLENVNVNTLRIQVVRGKGAKSRVVYMSKEAAERVKKWLEIRGTDVLVGDWLFSPLTAYGTPLIGKRVNDQTIQLLIQRRANIAGIGEVRPHDLRRFMASTLLSNGAGIEVLATILGHASVNTSRVYDIRGEEVIIEATKKLPRIEF